MPCSLHVLHEVLALLDGGLQLGDGLGDHLLLEGRHLADAQVFLQALFLQDRAGGRGKKLGQARRSRALSRGEDPGLGAPYACALDRHVTSRSVLLARPPMELGQCPGRVTRLGKPAQSVSHGHHST